MRVIRESGLVPSVETNIFLNPILREAIHIKIPFVNTYYILMGDLEKRYAAAESSIDKARQNMFWEQARIIFGGRASRSYQTS